jgi:bacillolysin
VRRISSLVLFLLVLLGLARVLAAPPRQGVRPDSTSSPARDDVSALNTQDVRVNALVQRGQLSVRSVEPDLILAGHQHERFDRYVNGVRVFGGDITRQSADGSTTSIFGTFYDGIAIGTTPALTAEAARTAFAQMNGAELPADRPVELVILPREDGSFALAWRTHVRTSGKWLQTFIDASTGVVLLQYSDVHTQAAVGTGTGVLGDTKKISTRPLNGRFIADDQLRPPSLVTYDAQGSVTRTESWLNGTSPAVNDTASDDDNVWTDAANVDAHVNIGWTYDFYYKVFGRHGLNDHDAPIRSISHPVNRSDLLSASSDVVSTYYLNAFWCDGCGPGGQGMMVFGEGLSDDYVLSSSRQHVNYFAGALDVVAHELTHGVTAYTSNLEYLNESGALNESFSDMMGTSAEFYYQTPGSGLGQADYLIGEDVITPGGIRSMSNPASFGDPDHYTQRFQGADDNGGVHTNSAIPNQAFYLAIEGGTNRTSGLSVQGVGGANREQIEKVFYRAFTQLLPSNATFHTARTATIQSARDLYGAGSPAETAVTQAWTAVGVN